MSAGAWERGIDFERVFAAIEKSAYSGWVGAEYKPVGATAESLGWRDWA